MAAIQVRVNGPVSDRPKISSFIRGKWYVSDMSGSIPVSRAKTTVAGPFDTEFESDRWCKENVGFGWVYQSPIDQ
jgi:hypothetical protein